MTSYRYNRQVPSSVEVRKIFDDLDGYREFCVEFGRRFNEADLYNERHRDYSDYLRWKDSGHASNQWNWVKEKTPDRKPYYSRTNGSNNGAGYTSNRSYQHAPRSR